MVKNYLMMEREGAETFEYVLMVSMLVALLIILFKLIGPTFLNKMNEIAKGVSESGANMMGIGGGFADKH